MKPKKLTFIDGDSINLLLDIDKVAPPFAIDLYIVMLYPNGKIYSGMEWSKGVKPVLNSFPLPSKYFVEDIVLMDLSIPSDNPPVGITGKYTFAVAAMNANTTEFISNIATTSFEVVE